MRSLFIPPLAGRIAFAEALGTDLHVIFSDGTHQRFSADLKSPSYAASDTRALERNLPRSVLPTNLTADANKGMLYALVTARQAARLDTEALDHAPQGKEKEPEPEPESAKGAAISRTDFNEAAPSTAIEDQLSPLNNADRAIVRYANGDWHFDRNAPEDLRLESLVLAMFARGGVIHLIYKSEAGHALHRVSDATTSLWSDAIMPPETLEFPAEVIGTGWLEEAPILVCHAQDDRIALFKFQPESKTWDGETVIKNEDDGPLLMTQPVYATFFDGQVVLIYQGADGIPSAGFWSAETGAIAHGFSPLSELTGYDFPFISPVDRSIVVYAVVIAIITATVIWRRETFVSRVSLKDNQVLAHFSYRFLALLVDLAILAPAWVPLLYRMWASVPEGFHFTFEAATRVAPPPAGIYWSPVVLGSIYAFYAAIFEWLIRATPGKRIFGLSVVQRGGQRCALGRILVRNITRVLEFHFPPLIVLAFLAPNRQRLGDLLAGSYVVIEWLPETPTDHSSDDESDHPTG